MSPARERPTIWAARSGSTWPSSPRPGGATGSSSTPASPSRSWTPRRPKRPCASSESWRRPKMKELRDPKALRRLLADIGELSRKTGRAPRLMEVCGTHTMALFKSGLTPMLADAGVEMVSGPGCPVCITPNGIHEAAIAIVTGVEGVTLAAFGDMTRVPTRKGSLQTAVPACRSRLRIVYSPTEALYEARRDPARPVVFFGAGFETTIPAIAYTVKRAASEGLANYTVLPALWLVPPALRAILEAGEVAVDG